MKKLRRWWLLVFTSSAILAFWLVRRRRPVIEQVEVLKPDEPLTVRGRHLGAGQNGSAVEIQSGGEQIAPLQIDSWSETRITVTLPAGTHAAMAGRPATVQVIVPGRGRSKALPLVCQTAGAGREPYNYAVPVQPDAPWPSFRRDHRNSGYSPVPAHYPGDKPWSFQTGKGIFSTPVIDGQGTIYIGSADHMFYALTPDGRVKWRCQTGEVIDSAGALLPAELVGSEAIVFPSGDGFLRCLRTADGSPLWSLDSRLAERDSYNNWFEGNVAVGYDGTLYAGNTNFNYYAISPQGELKWTYPAGANAWSNAALGQDGTIYWASLDTLIRAIRPDGTERWRRRTLGMLAASAAVGSDGTVYIGSFDSYFYALEPQTGRVRWKFKTGDHIYCSAALGQDENGQTRTIYVGSADGSLYALTPAGELRWAYDCGAPIRSSPVVGRAPDGESGEIVYFGAGNGRLYAIEGASGRRRWAFDTNSDQPELVDRNDLNGSPALAQSGVVIGGEHGQVWYVPYDYPLHAPEDPRCLGPADDELPAELQTFLYVTPGGNLRPGNIPPLPPATVLTLRLMVRHNGRTVDAHLFNSPLGRPNEALQVNISPPTPLHWEVSADGRHLHLIPDGILEADVEYRVTIGATVYRGGLSIGNLTLGGRPCGRVEQTLTFRTTPADEPWPLSLDEEKTTALEWTRLSVPIPTMMPSLNQIGFDYIDWIIGLVDQAPESATAGGRCVLWAIGGRRDENGRLVADPESDFTLPFNGRYQNNAFILENRNFTLPVTGIPIPFNRFQMRGQLGANLRVRPGASAFADTRILSIPTFGPLMVLAGLGSNGWNKLLAMATYVTRPYPAEGPAHRRPAGISVSALDYRPPTNGQVGQVHATIQVEAGVAYPLAQHRPGILLLDSARHQAVELDYHANLNATAGAAGNLATIHLTIPADTRLPANLAAVVILDVFPLQRFTLAEA